jgi:hypothetical protein
MKIAILGWGSLIWDIREFNNHIENWNKSDLKLPIEFSRISSSRGGALTLVIDLENGIDVNVRYAIAKSSSLEENIELLRKREGTTLKNIGFVDLVNNTFKTYNEEIIPNIKNWAKENDIDAVIWTDLKSNYEQKLGKKFKVDESFEYLLSLPKEIQQGAFEYIKKAPKEVKTPLRKYIEKGEYDVYR